MRRAYLDGPFGQLHVRFTGEAMGTPVVIGLPPAPSSGLYLTTLTAALAARGRASIALDYPGYGASDEAPAPPSIADYAKAALAVADETSPSAPVVLFGFHTGCLVAVEASLQRPERVRACVLIDVPYFEAAARPALAAKLGAAKAISWDLAESLADPWAFSMTQRQGLMSLERAYALFIEHARTGAGMNAAFAAAFAYDAQARFAAFAALKSAATTIIATRSGLLEPTRRAAAALADARFVERLDVDKAALELGAEILAEEIERALKR